MMAKKDYENYLFVPSRLRLLRMFHGLSMQELADKTGLSKQAIGRYESGDLRPSMLSLIGLASAFEMPKNYFTDTIINIKITGNKITFENL